MPMEEESDSPSHGGDGAQARRTGQSLEARVEAMEATLEWIAWVIRHGPPVYDPSAIGEGASIDESGGGTGVDGGGALPDRGGLSGSADAASVVAARAGELVSPSVADDAAWTGDDVAQAKTTELERSASGLSSGTQATAPETEIAPGAKAQPAATGGGTSAAGVEASAASDGDDTSSGRAGAVGVEAIATSDETTAAGDESDAARNSDLPAGMHAAEGHARFSSDEEAGPLAGDSKPGALAPSRQEDGHLAEEEDAHRDEESSPAREEPSPADADASTDADSSDADRGQAARADESLREDEDAALVQAQGSLQPEPEQPPRPKKSQARLAFERFIAKAKQEGNVGRYLLSGVSALLVIMAAVSFIALVWDSIPSPVKVGALGCLGVIMVACGVQLSARKPGQAVAASTLTGTGGAMGFVAIIGAVILDGGVVPIWLAFALMTAWGLALLALARIAGQFFTAIVSSIGALATVDFASRYEMDTFEPAVLWLFICAYVTVLAITASLLPGRGRSMIMAPWFPTTSMVVTAYTLFALPSGRIAARSPALLDAIVLLLSAVLLIQVFHSSQLLWESRFRAVAGFDWAAVGVVVVLGSGKTGLVDRGIAGGSAHDDFVFSVLFLVLFAAVAALFMLNGGQDGWRRRCGLVFLAIALAAAVLIAASDERTLAFAVLVVGLAALPLLQEGSLGLSWVMVLVPAAGLLSPLFLVTAEEEGSLFFRTDVGRGAFASALIGALLAVALTVVGERVLEKARKSVAGQQASLGAQAAPGPQVVDEAVAGPQVTAGQQAATGAQAVPGQQVAPETEPPAGSTDRTEEQAAHTPGMAADGTQRGIRDAVSFHSRVMVAASWIVSLTLIADVPMYVQELLARGDLRVAAPTALAVITFEVLLLRGLMREDITPYRLLVAARRGPVVQSATAFARAIAWVVWALSGFIAAMTILRAELLESALWEPLFAALALSLCAVMSGVLWGLDLVRRDVRFVLALAGLDTIILWWSFVSLTGQSPGSILMTALILATGALCVALGFRLRVKVLRHYGLVLIMASVLKLAAYDITANDSITRTLVLAGGGVVCFVLSLAYSRIASDGEGAGDVTRNPGDVVEESDVTQTEDNAVRDSGDALEESDVTRDPGGAVLGKVDVARSEGDAYDKADAARDGSGAVDESDVTREPDDTVQGSDDAGVAP